MWPIVVTNGLLFGGLITAWMLVAIFGSLRWNPEIWVNDYPPEIRAVLPPKSARARRQSLWVSVPTALVLVGLIAGLVIRLNDASGGFAGFLPIAAGLWIALQLFNLVDLVIVDWLIIETVRPSWTLLPGTAPFAGQRFYRFHFNAFLKGFVGITVASLVIAGALAVVDWLL